MWPTIRYAVIESWPSERQIPSLQNMISEFWFQSEKTIQRNMLQMGLAAEYPIGLARPRHPSVGTITNCEARPRHRSVGTITNCEARPRHPSVGTITDCEARPRHQSVGTITDCEPALCLVLFVPSSPFLRHVDLWLWVAESGAKKRLLIIGCPKQHIVYN